MAVYISKAMVYHDFIQRSLKSGSAQVQRQSLTMVLAGNKAKRRSPVNHTTKTIQFIIPLLFYSLLSKESLQLSFLL